MSLTAQQNQQLINIDSIYSNIRLNNELRLPQRLYQRSNQALQLTHRTLQMNSSELAPHLVAELTKVGPCFHRVTFSVAVTKAYFVSLFSPKTFQVCNLLVFLLCSRERAINHMRPFSGRKHPKNYLILHN